MSDNWQTLKAWPELILDRLADAGVARITLNRPEKRNAWNEAMVEAFFESLEIVRGDRELKVVITRGAGPLFSSGLDLYFLKEANASPRDGGAGRGAAHLPPRHDGAGTRLLPGWRARHHELP
jgi:enoyl-CoA hydratase/carnithine racemase